MAQLVGPSAVVTGVSRGIGKAIAIALAEAGANVIGVYLDDPDGAAEVVAAAAALGREAIVIEADTGRPETAERLATEAVDRWGSLDIWVNNAARLLVKPIVATTDEDWHGLLAANLHGYFYGCRAALKRMYRQRRGRVINISSAADIQALSNLGAYVAAKGGIVGLTKVLAIEAGRYGVTVNAVAPGAIDTPLNVTAWTAEARAAYMERIPLGIGQPEQIADVVVFVASTASRYMTGHELLVDGGLVINGSVGHAVDD